MIKIMIADDIIPIAKRYEKILKKDDEIEVVAVVNSGYEAVLQCALHKPDVVMMDIEMESQTAGLNATSHILEHFPETKIIILTVYEDDETVFKAFQLGVTDYILKNSAPENILTCVKDAYNNRSPIRPSIAHKIRREFQRIKKNEDSFLYCLHLITELTQTELDILDLTCQGYTRKEICDMRCVELSTIKTQIRNILKKFDCTSMSEVICVMEKSCILDYLHNLKNNSF